MKTIIRLTILFTIAALLLTLCGCGQSKSPSQQLKSSAETTAVVEEVTQAPTEAPTEKPTEPPTEAPTQPPTEPPTDPPTDPPHVEQPPVDPPQVIDDEATYLDELTSSNYVLSRAVSDGESWNYGSIVAQTGAHIKFYDDYTFECVLGMNYFEGRFQLDSGVITITIDKAYDGAGATTVDYDRTVVWNRAENTLKLTYTDRYDNTIDNYFAEK